MTNDPGISTRSFSDDKLDFDDSHHLDTHVDGRPRDPRWGGGRPEITPRRARAIAARREFLEHQDELENFARELPPAATVDLVTARDVDLAIGAAGELPELALHLLARFAMCVLCGYDGIAISYPELGKALGKSGAAVKRACAALLAFRLPLLVRVCQVHEQHGAASSVRCVAYRLYPGVATVLGGIATRRKSDLASGTVLAAEEPFQGSSCSSLLYARSHQTQQCSPAAPAARSVSASPTVDCRTAVPAVLADGTGPVARQGETRRAALKARDGDGVELTVAEVSWLAIIDDETADPAARDMAREALHDYRRHRARRANGLGDTFDEYARYREQVRRSTFVAAVDYRRGGDS